MRYCDEILRDSQPTLAMSGEDADSPIRLSVLDRLAAPRADAPSASSARRTASHEEMKTIVRRDLEWLLSTRRSAPRRSEERLGRTVIEYGIPDFAPVSPSDEQALSRIAYHIRTAIEAFEPRLTDVTVHVEPALQPGRVQATVDALLTIGEMRTPVSFPFKVRTRG